MENGSTEKRHIELKEYLISKGHPIKEVNGLIERYATRRCTKKDRGLIDKYIIYVNGLKQFNKDLKG